MGDRIPSGRPLNSQTNYRRLLMWGQDQFFRGALVGRGKNVARSGVTHAPPGVLGARPALLLKRYRGIPFPASDLEFAAILPEKGVMEDARCDALHFLKTISLHN
jgi:hypothetical protein